MTIISSEYDFNWPKRRNVNKTSCLAAQTFFIHPISFFLWSPENDYFRDYFCRMLLFRFGRTSANTTQFGLAVELWWQNEVKTYTYFSCSRFHCVMCFVCPGFSFQGTFVWCRANSKQVSRIYTWSYCQKVLDQWKLLISFHIQCQKSLISPRVTCPCVLLQPREVMWYKNEHFQWYTITAFFLEN